MYVCTAQKRRMEKYFSDAQGLNIYYPANIAVLGGVEM